MRVNTSKHLPWLLMIVAVFWSWQLNVLAFSNVEPFHQTCDNEKRYENQVMCAGKEFGCLVPYPDNCSLFLVCDCLYPTVKLCPANLWWDNNTQLCNYPQAVDCIYYDIEPTEPSDGSTLTTQGSTASTTKGTTTTPTITYPTSSWDPPPPPPGISDDFCHSFRDGSVHRYPYDCQAYINCTHGWPVLNYCDEDKAFNALLLICDTPDAANCTAVPLPTTTTAEVPSSTKTTDIPTTSTTEGSFTCGPGPEGIEDDYCQSMGNGFYKYPYNCSGYLDCRNGCTDLDYCQEDKLFNDLLHICDTPNSVICDDKPFPTTTSAGTTKRTTTTPLTTSPVPTSGPTFTTQSPTSTTVGTTTTTPGLPPDVDPEDCKGYPDGTIFPYAGNCSQYLFCKNNQVEMGECPLNLLFNYKILLCDEADDVECYGDRTTTPLPTTKPPTTTPEPTTPTTTTTTKATTLGPSELCEGQAVGASYAYPEDCSQYYLCLGNGKWTLAPCIYESFFDPSTGICGPDVSPEACKATATTTTTTTTTVSTTTEEVTSTKTTTVQPTTTPRTTTTEGPSSGICAGRNDGENIAYPNNCNKYIVCVSPIPIAFYCPADTFFSSEEKNCIESWEDSDCEDGQGTTTSEPGYTRPPPEPTMCTNSTRDTFPYPDNCQWFIRCVDDYIYMMDVCNCGEYYDPIAQKCGPDVPSDACRWDYTSTTTTEQPTTTTEPTTTSPVTRPPPQKGPCDDVDDGALVPYPNDCTKYIQCSRPIAEAFDCDEGDEFSVEFGKCVDAELANCSITTTAKPTESTTPTTEGDSSTSSTQPTTEPSTSTTTELSTVSSTQEPTTSTTETSTSPSTTVSTTEEPTTSSTETSTRPSTTASTTVSTTPEPGSSTTVKPKDGVCDGKVDDSLVPYPNDCGKYIMCQYPIPVGYDCPYGLEFSPTDLTCMDPDLAGCSPKPTTPGLTTTTTEKPTTQGSTTPKTTTTESTTISSTTASTTASTTPQTTTTDSTTVSTTPKTTTTESTTPKTTTTESTTVSTTTESTTISTTPKTTTTKTTTVSTTPQTTTTESTTASTTPKTTTTETSTISTTASTTTESTTISTTTKPTTPTTTTEAPLPTLDPYTPNICCGQALGTWLPYPNDCSRYVVCDYPIPYSVDCPEGTVFDDKLLQCSAVPNERCLYEQY
ncbi:uncharacterized protein [Drosophila bipectinata]|uniref:uncharacterized protein n=1 Tax=Drosophila bipectinata TaxID=42026 RepID=UPI001C8AE623|nr:mucin-2 [Drosophila bipectinata]